MTPGHSHGNRSLVLALVAAGCTGQFEATGETPAETPPTMGAAAPGERPVVTVAPGEVVPVESRVWRLTRAQYTNVVRDLLGETGTPASGFLPEEGGTGFSNAELTLGFTVPHMDQFLKAARKLAAEILAAPARLSTVFPCGEAKLADEGCARDFVAKFGRRAFRRPLTAEEVSGYVGLYTTYKTKLDARLAVQLVLEAMLQSPSFLFRVEAGNGKPDGKGRVPLTAHELAVQLSFYLWNTMPDPVLDVVADSGALLGRAEIEKQARRMLADPRAKATIGLFFRELLDLDGAESLSKQGGADKLYAAAKAGLSRELERFLGEVLFVDDGSFGKLLTAPYTVLDSGLAAIYGVPAPAAGEWRKVTLDPAERAGLLTHPALMAVTSHPAGTSPVLRGKFVSERVLCTEIPDPPPDVNADEPKSDAGRTTRQRFEQHATSPSCAGCHQLLDAPGYAFEHLDWIGRVRRTENKLPVDTAGELRGTDVDGRFADVRGLADKLAGSRQARECLARQVFRYAGGRKEGEGDGGALAEMVAGFGKSGWKVPELLLGPVLSDRFVNRRAN